MIFGNILNNNISYLIEKHGVKISSLSDELNVNRNTFTSYLNSKRLPKLDFVVKFAKYFNISLDDLVFKDLSRPDTVMDGRPVYHKKDIANILKQNELQAKEIELLKKEVELIRTESKNIIDNQKKTITKLMKELETCKNIKKLT